MIQQGRFSPIWALLVPLFMIKSSASNEYTAAVYEHSTVFELGIHTRSQALKVMKENIAVFQEKLNSVHFVSNVVGKVSLECLT